MLAGTSGSTLAFGPGHLTGTASPGESGNIVISGHRDTHFENLKHVRIGDMFDLNTAEGDFKRYEVAEINVVDKSTVEVAHDYGDDRLTLITCYPFDSTNYGGPLRYVVIAKPISKYIVASQ